MRSSAGIHEMGVARSSKAVERDARKARLGASAAARPGTASTKGYPTTPPAGHGLLTASPLPDHRGFDGIYTDEGGGGTLKYQLNLSSALCDRPPLFVMLHGASQSASDFAIGTRMADVVAECGGIALFPEQSRNAHPLGCWNWYDVRHQLAEGGEPSLLVGLTRMIAANHGVDQRRIYVAGMSAGGAMAVILGQAFPSVFAAVGVHSGIPKGAAHNLVSALRTMSSGPLKERLGESAPSHRIPTIVFHGDNDRTVNPLNAMAVLTQSLRSEGASSTTDILSTGPPSMLGGREVTLTTCRRRKRPSHAELWIVHGNGHAWTGGDSKGSYTDEAGPDASREMARFFLTQSLTRERSNGRA